MDNYLVLRLVVSVLYGAQIWLVVHAQALVLQPEDSRDILYITSQNYIGGSDPQIIGFQLVPDHNSGGQTSSDILAALLGQQSGQGRSVLTQNLPPNKPAYSEFQDFSHGQQAPTGQGYGPTHPYEQYDSGRVRARQPAQRTASDYTPYGSEKSEGSQTASTRLKRPYGRRRPTGSNRKRQRGRRERKKPAYFPIQLKQQTKRKKVKTLAVSRGFYVAGGSQVYGRFQSLKACQRACDRTPNCFAGDYDQTTYRCYRHDASSACSAMTPRKALTHFKKVPCSAEEVGIQNGLLNLGMNLFHGLLQKGVSNIQTCLKRCLQAGGGVAARNEDAATTPQLCFGIDYNFATHKCYHHTSATVLYDDPANPGTIITALMGIDGGVQCDSSGMASARKMTANPNVVNFLICPHSAA